MRVRVPFCAIASVDFFGGDEKANKSEVCVPKTLSEFDDVVKSLKLAE
jgi:hypothetical protein